MRNKLTLSSDLTHTEFRLECCEASHLMSSLPSKSYNTKSMPFLCLCSASAWKPLPVCSIMILCCQIRSASGEFLVVYNYALSKFFKNLSDLLDVDLTMAWFWYSIGQCLVHYTLALPKLLINNNTNLMST